MLSSKTPPPDLILEIYSLFYDNNLVSLFLDHPLNHVFSCVGLMGLDWIAAAQSVPGGVVARVALRGVAALVSDTLM
jgi:hypothetical protein